MTRLVLALFLVGGAGFAASTVPHSKGADQRTKQRPVDRGPGILSAEKEQVDIKALEELEASLGDLHRFNTEGKAPNGMPQTGERNPQSIPRSMNEAAQ